MTSPTAGYFVVLGALQFCILFASAIVPFQLDWKNQLAQLPRLLRQLFWVYGAYVVLAIVSLAAICVAAADELAAGGRLATCFCIYGAAFWGIRLSLQPVLNAKPHLTNLALRIGYQSLTVVFATVTAMYLAALL
ncbi:MAG: hypothetical protein R3C19_17250 [Planctomycetaceae bacterium]